MKKIVLILSEDRLEREFSSNFMESNYLVEEIIWNKGMRAQDIKYDADLFILSDRLSKTQQVHSYMAISKRVKHMLKFSDDAVTPPQVLFLRPDGNLTFELGSIEGLEYTFYYGKKSRKEIFRFIGQIFSGPKIGFDPSPNSKELFHDLNQIANQVLGLTELINESGQLAGTSLEYLQRIEHVMENFVLASNAHFGLKTETLLSPKKIVQACIDAHESAADRQRVKIKLVFNESSSTKVNQAGLTRILNNLISNALKFSSSGQEILVGIQGLGDYLAVSIIDHGPGISMDVVDESNLEDFLRQSSKVNSQTDSNGIGLKSSFQLAKENGYKLRLSRAPQGGTMASIFIQSKSSHSEKIVP